MSEQAAALLDGFVLALRGMGVAVPMEAHAQFLAGLRALPPASIDGLYWLARTSLLRCRDDIEPFDQLFQAWFKEGRVGVETDGETAPDAEDRPAPAGREMGGPLPVMPGEGTGKAAASDDLRGARAEADDLEQDPGLRRFGREVVAALPERRSRRLRPDRHGRAIDLRRTVRAAVRQGGEITGLVRRGRPARKRALVLLVDVSGSHQGLIDGHLRMARAISEQTPCEVFCFGSRLTRLTRALAGASAQAAHERALAAIPDFAGGTRIGPALAALLGEPRFAGLLRGAVVMVVSDGLERGDPAIMAASARRIARLAHRLVWLTPLAGDPRFRPRTRGLLAVLPHLDRLGSAADQAAILAEFGRLRALERTGRTLA
ncbi:VWA domain-containing protein [Geminicoccus roseus]|uniref:VWA domain-containing protein n=1 Tax=Geminicoccus roseus TaxID=404900 RepID=UPI000420D776|nr:VWA domain-containing protein [Geminicoccus roseus]